MALTMSGNSATNQYASQQPSATTRKRINQQQQTPYAAENGMALQNALSGAAPAATQSAGSPVTATGQIAAQPAPQPQVQPAQTSQPAPAPTMTTTVKTTAPAQDPFAAMGGGVQLPGGGWVPMNHPLAKTAAPAAGGGASAPTYNPQQLANVSSQAIINSIQNPMLSQNWINQQRGALRDQNAMALQQQQQLAMEQNAANGTFGSGAMSQLLGRMGDQSQSNLLNAYRQTDLDAAQANRDDLYRWSGLGMENFYTGRGQDLNQALGMAGVDADRYRTKMGLVGDLLGFQSGRERLGYDYTALNAAQQQALWQSLLR